MPLRHREILVNELDRHGALADSGCDTVHCAGTKVARDEDARDTRLERERLALEFPVAFEIVVERDVAAGMNEPLVASQHFRRQPGSMRARADKDEECCELLDATLCTVEA